MNEKREVFISVDVETAGPIPGEFSLLTVGATLVDDEAKSFSCALKPINRNADPKALEVTGLSIDELERTGLPPRDAMLQLKTWVDEVAGLDGVPIFVGFNAAFDWSFINYYFHKFLGENPFGFAALDIKSFYMGAVGSSWRETRSSEIAKRLSPRRHSGDHDALHDAKYQAELFRLARQRRPDH
jgi:ribonuclease T